jgi:salicylate hydroxylase
MLRSAAEGAGVEIQLAQEVTDVEAGPQALVHQAHGNPLSADLVIGADGVRSAMRRKLNPQTGDPRFTGQVAWRAVVPNSTRVPSEARVYMGPKRHLVSYPLRDGRFVNVVAVQERDVWASEGWAQSDHPDNLRAAFADFGNETQALLERVEDVGLWGLFDHPVAANWHAGTVAMIGDAAHPMLPFLAQGANMALEDAWALAACLENGSMSEALSRYQDLRRDRVARVMKTAQANAKRYHLKSPIVRGIAHSALHMASTWAPQRMLGQFDWLYRYDITSQIE